MYSCSYQRNIKYVVPRFNGKFYLNNLNDQFVLSFISAIELIMLQNKMDKLYFNNQQQNALQMLKDFISLKSITVIKHNDYFRWRHCKQ